MRGVGDHPNSFRDCAPTVGTVAICVATTPTVSTIARNRERRRLCTVDSMQRYDRDDNTAQWRSRETADRALPQVGRGVGGPITPVRTRATLWGEFYLDA